MSVETHTCLTVTVFLPIQDTVVGMMALAEAAGALQSTDTDVSVRFIFGPRGKNMRVSRSNALTLQKYEVGRLNLTIFATIGKYYWGLVFQ